MPVGIGPQVQPMQFPLIQQDPFTTAIKAYQGVMQGRLAGSQNQELQERMPFVGPQAEAALQKALAEIEHTKEQIKWHGPQAEASIAASQATVQLHKAQTQQANLANQLTSAQLPLKKKEIEAEMIQLQKYIDYKKSQISGMSENQNNPNQITNFTQTAQQPQQYPANLTQNNAQGFNPEINAQVGNQIANQPGQTNQATISKQPNYPSPDNYLKTNPVANEMGEYGKKFEEKWMSAETLAGNKAGAEAREKSQVDYYDKMSAPIDDASQQAAEANDLLDLMVQNWENIPSRSKGIAWGRLPAWEGAGMTFEKAFSELVQKKMQLQKGNQNENDRKLFENSVPKRANDDEGFYKIYAYDKAMTNRLMQKQEFFARHKDKDFRQVLSAWNEYVQNNSLFNSPAYQQAYLPYLEKRASELKQMRDSSLNPSRGAS